MSLGKRIEKLEVMCRPSRQPVPSLIILDGDGEPLNKRYAEVLRLNQEAASRGEDTCLTILQMQQHRY